MKAKHWTVIGIFLILAALHQDLWNWDNPSLVFGFLPAGLAYHAAYSLAVAVYWFCVAKFAWPQQLEDWAEGGAAMTNDEIPNDE